MNNFEQLLSGTDLRSIGNSNRVVELVSSQEAFNELFNFLRHPSRPTAMRAIDAVEKISIAFPDYLQQHKTELLKMCKKEAEKEIKWHLALLIPRLRLTEKELAGVWSIFSAWASDKYESKIVRVNALQALNDLLAMFPSRMRHIDFKSLTASIYKEHIPSINARIRKLRL